jgi:hypothetical protein
MPSEVEVRNLPVVNLYGAALLGTPEIFGARLSTTLSPSDSATVFFRRRVGDWLKVLLVPRDFGPLENRQARDFPCVTQDKHFPHLKPGSRSEKKFSEYVVNGVG